MNQAITILKDRIDSLMEQKEQIGWKTAHRFLKL